MEDGDWVVATVEVAGNDTAGVEDTVSCGLREGVEGGRGSVVRGTAVVPWFVELVCVPGGEGEGDARGKVAGVSGIAGVLVSNPNREVVVPTPTSGMLVAPSNRGALVLTSICAVLDLIPNSGVLVPTST